MLCCILVRNVLNTHARARPDSTITPSFILMAIKGPKVNDEAVCLYYGPALHRFTCLLNPAQVIIYVYELKGKKDKPLVRCVVCLHESMDLFVLHTEIWCTAGVQERILEGAEG